MRGFSTNAIHGSALKKDVHGALRTPIYENVAFEFETSHALELAFEGKALGHSYTRISNPTVEDFEQRIRLLTDATGVVAVSSGMAAISNVILVLAETGSNIISSRRLFGNTYSLFEHTLKPWGMEVRYADMTKPKSLKQSITEKTRAVFLETITNPQLEVADIAEVSSTAAAAGIPVILDGTLTTPYLFKSKDFGVAVEVVSSTKHISGGATTVGGLIVDNGNYDWSTCPRLKKASAQYGPFALIALLRREAYRNFGSCLSPHNAYMQSLGLETLSLRIEKSCTNALAIALFLETCTEVRSVNYPGLAASPGHETAKRQFGNRFGSILTFDLADKDTCFRFMDSLSLVRRATNINDNKTLILHPASTIFCEYSEEEKKRLGVPASMLRLAVGIEDAEDIIADLREGLKKL
ncbi:MAG: O-acetylhomoserine aminocarboxypropyltransferase/cysteine synthase [Deltaproteobacteria bacterium]|nr:O-acetylhomoserine aminocarboxypropyltransferase/cysteine synthase [Deltaproteobacteria bacterium]